jgi:hypothetical protein
MRDQHPFLAADLLELEAFLDEASAVVAMEDAAGDFTDESMIALRHDVDNAIGPPWRWRNGKPSAATAPPTSSSTLRPTGRRRTPSKLPRNIAGCGHEIGFHINAISEAITPARSARHRRRSRRRTSRLRLRGPRRRTSRRPALPRSRLRQRRTLHREPSPDLRRTGSLGGRREARARVSSDSRLRLRPELATARRWCV